jgi:hypothetical protein
MPADRLIGIFIILSETSRIHSKCGLILFSWHFRSEPLVYGVKILNRFTPNHTDEYCKQNTQSLAKNITE